MSATRFGSVAHWGDEPLFMDGNGNVANDDCDPDVAAQGETGQDRRYFYHQDRNWNVIPLTEYNDGVARCQRAGKTSQDRRRFRGRFHSPTEPNQGGCVRWSALNANKCLCFVARQKFEDGVVPST
jgi:hypothetical protein